jgi:hypothetical protein
LTADALNQQQLNQLALQQLQLGQGQVQDLDLASGLRILEQLNQQDPNSWTDEQKLQYNYLAELINSQLNASQLNQLYGLNPLQLSIDPIQYQQILQQQLLG